MLAAGSNAKSIVLRPFRSVGLFNQVLAIMGGIKLAAVTGRAPLINWKTQTDLSGLFQSRVIPGGGWDVQTAVQEHGGSADKYDP